MKKMRRRAALLLACSMLFLSACNSGGDEQPDGEETSTPPVQTSQLPVPTDTPEPTQEPEPEGPVSLLTGLPVEDEAQVNARPVAIMLNNLAAALPQQGNSGASIIYEVVAEGGITRMLGVYESVEGIGTIGSVRSARPYYIELALGHDAIFIHAGGSEDAYTALSSWKVDHMDGVRGNYSSAAAGLFWRDRDRVAGHHYDLEHSLVTSGEAVQTVVANSGFRLDHGEDYSYEMTFAEDGTPEGGETAGTITVPFSGYKTGVFRYDADSGLYLVEQRGDAYIDGNTGEQIAVTNVLILCTKVKDTGDSYGHVEVDLAGGSGWFACGGKLIPITWEKDGRDGQLTYFTEESQPLTLGVGKSYVNIIDQSRTVTWE